MFLHYEYYNSKCQYNLNICAIATKLLIISKTIIYLQLKFFFAYKN